MLSSMLPSSLPVVWGYGSSFHMAPSTKVTAPGKAPCGALENSLGQMVTPCRRSSDGAARVVSFAGRRGRRASRDGAARRNSALAAAFLRPPEADMGSGLAETSISNGIQTGNRTTISDITTLRRASMPAAPVWRSLVPGDVVAPIAAVSKFRLPTEAHGSPGESTTPLSCISKQSSPRQLKCPSLTPGIHVTDTSIDSGLQFPQTYSQYHQYRHQLQQQQQQQPSRHQQQPSAVPSLPLLPTLPSGSQGSGSPRYPAGNEYSDEEALAVALSPPRSHSLLRRRITSPRYARGTTEMSLVNRAKQYFVDQSVEVGMRRCTPTKPGRHFGMLPKKHRKISFSRRVEIVFFVKSESVKAKPARGYIFQ